MIPIRYEPFLPLATISTREPFSTGSRITFADGTPAPVSSTTVPYILACWAIVPVAASPIATAIPTNRPTHRLLTGLLPAHSHAGGDSSPRALESRSCGSLIARSSCSSSFPWPLSWRSSRPQRSSASPPGGWVWDRRGSSPRAGRFMRRSPPADDRRERRVDARATSRSIRRREQRSASDWSFGTASRARWRRSSRSTSGTWGSIAAVAGLARRGPRRCGPSQSTSSPCFPTLRVSRRLSLPHFGPRG